MRSGLLPAGLWPGPVIIITNLSDPTVHCGRPRDRAAAPGAKAQASQRRLQATAFRTVDDQMLRCRHSLGCLVVKTLGSSFRPGGFTCCDGEAGQQQVSYLCSHVVTDAQQSTLFSGPKSTSQHEMPNLGRHQPATRPVVKTKQDARLGKNRNHSPSSPPVRLGDTMIL